MIDLNKLSKQAYEVAQRRESNGANIKTDTISMLKHCAGEVVEATEAYCDFVYEMTDEYEEKFQDEVADIMTCCLKWCNNGYFERICKGLVIWKY